MTTLGYGAAAVLALCVLYGAARLYRGRRWPADVMPARYRPRDAYGRSYPDEP